jgi:hypothetical protein
MTDQSTVRWNPTHTAPTSSTKQPEHHRAAEIVEENEKTPLAKRGAHLLLAVRKTYDRGS